MYKQKPGDPLKKLDSPTTFREDSPMMKLAKDGSNPMFKYDSPLNDNHPDDDKKMKGDRIKTEKLKEVVVYAQRPNRKKPNEVGGRNAASGPNPGARFTAKKGKPVI
jgi:hypothetical protein